MEELLKEFRNEMNQNLTKTRYVTFPEDATPEIRQYLFVTETYVKSAEEAFMEVIKKIKDAP